MYVDVTHTSTLDKARAKVELSGNAQSVLLHLHATGVNSGPYLHLAFDEAEWLLEKLQAVVAQGREVRETAAQQ